MNSKAFTVSNEGEVEKSNTIDFSQNNEIEKKTINSNVETDVSEKKATILKDDITKEDVSDVSEKNIQRALERKKRLQKFHNLNFNNQVVLRELEDEPAYKRQGLELEEPTHSSSEPHSRTILDSTDEGIEIKNNNSFLHDNVD